MKKTKEFGFKLPTPKPKAPKYMRPNWFPHQPWLKLKFFDLPKLKDYLAIQLEFHHHNHMVLNWTSIGVYNSSLEFLQGHFRFGIKTKMLDNQRENQTKTSSIHHNEIEP